MRMAPDRYRFATRLNSFRERGGESESALVDRRRTVARVPGLSAVELNYPQHLHGRHEAALREAFAETGWR